MKTTESVHPGLPPGLWVPTADESTEKYRTEQLMRPGLEYEDIVDFGTFAVAMALFDQDRINFQLTRNDFQDLYAKGYGITPTHLNKVGLNRINQSLGFYPRGSAPDLDELAGRLIWIRDYGYNAVSSDIPIEGLTFDEVLKWGAQRGLLPSRDRVYALCGGDTHELRKQTDLGHRLKKGSLPMLEVWRFGAKILQDNGAPLKYEEIDEQYADEFRSRPSWVIVSHAESFTKFWLEYGYVPHAVGMTRDDLISVGVRFRLEHPSVTLTEGKIDELSAAKRFPSRLPLYRQFGNIPSYRQEVEEALATYHDFCDALRADGVSDSVITSLANKFEVGEDYMQQLKSHINCLIKISAERSGYLTKIIKQGFNLLDNALFDMQLEDFDRIMRDRRFTHAQQVFIYSLIPHMNAEDAFRELTRIQGTQGL